MFGASSAVKLNDAPPYFNEPTWNELHPSAAGFVQISSCQKAGVEGVNCLPNAELFATGMNGDEDLGQDITMKGEPYHYQQKKEAMHVQLNDAPPFFNEPTWNELHPSAAGFVQSNFATGLDDREAVNIQWTPVVVDTKYEDLPKCHGTNGPEGVNCKEEKCDGTNGPKDGPVGTPCTRTQPATYTDGQSNTTGNKTPTSARDNKEFAQIKSKDDLSPEKVSILETTKAENHTTFYGQKKDEVKK